MRVEALGQGHPVDGAVGLQEDLALGQVEEERAALVAKLGAGMQQRAAPGAAVADPGDRAGDRDGAARRDRTVEYRLLHDMYGLPVIAAEFAHGRHHRAGERRQQRRQRAKRALVDIGERRRVERLGAQSEPERIEDRVALGPGERRPLDDPICLRRERHAKATRSGTCPANE